MPGPLKTSSSKQHQRQSEAAILKSFMDHRKPQNGSWQYYYPAFPAAPAAFSVNGVTYHPQFPGGGSENIGMGIWADTRGSGANLRQQNAAQAQQEANGNAHNTGAAAPAAAAAAGSQTRKSPASSDAVDKATSNPEHGALVPSRPSSPMSVSSAMQCLSGQLHDAIRLCTESLAAHADVLSKAQFTSASTRNGVWKDLLDHRFKESGFAHDGFRNLGRRMAFYMEQAHHAAQNDSAVGSGDTERRREAERRIRRLRLLRAECQEVVNLTEGASKDVLDCREMLGLMKDMKRKLVGKRGEAQQGENDGEEKENSDGGRETGDNSGDAEPATVW